MPSPPKPWERAGGTVASTAAPAPTTPAMTTPAAPLDSSAAPSVPARPATFSSTQNALDPNAASTTALNPYASTTTPYGASPYSRFGSYTSPYSSYGSTGYGGYGGYGSTYGGMGGMGSMYGGMGGGYGMGMPGMMPMDPNNPSLIQQVGSSTSQTFALIQSIVQTFGGFAQMLDSTFMATQSSFFAMLGVAEQFAHLRGALSQVFGVFGLVAWLRSWWKGERPNMKEEFKRFLQSPPPQNGPNGAPAPKPSKKPLIVFLLAVFGLPYAMHRLIKHLSQNLPQQPQQGQLPGSNPPAIDPSKLSFARATYAFQTTDPIELSLAKGEIVAVLNTQDPTTGAEGEWWQGRTRDGREGWFPASYVEVVKPKEALAPTAPATSASSLTPTKAVA